MWSQPNLASFAQLPGDIAAGFSPCQHFTKHIYTYTYTAYSIQHTQTPGFTEMSRFAAYYTFVLNNHVACETSQASRHRDIRCYISCLLMLCNHMFGKCVNADICSSGIEFQLQPQPDGQIDKSDYDPYAWRHGEDVVWADGWVQGANRKLPINKSLSLFLLKAGKKTGNVREVCTSMQPKTYSVRRMHLITWTGYLRSYAKCNMPRFNGSDCCLVLLCPAISSWERL